jgi:hypothetical protein
MMADLIPPEKRADAYSLLRMSNNVGVLRSFDRRVYRFGFVHDRLLLRRGRTGNVWSADHLVRA